MNSSFERGDNALNSKKKTLEKLQYLSEVEKGQFSSTKVEVVSRAVNRPTSAPPLLSVSSSAFIGMIRPTRSEVELTCGPLYCHRAQPELDLDWVDIKLLECDVMDSMVEHHGALRKPVTLRTSELHKVEVPKSFRGVRLVYGETMRYSETTTTSIYQSDESDDPCHGIINLDAGDQGDVNVKDTPDEVMDIDGGGTDDYCLFEEGRQPPPLESDLIQECTSYHYSCCFPWVRKFFNRCQEIPEVNTGGYSDIFMLQLGKTGWLYWCKMLDEIAEAEYLEEKEEEEKAEMSSCSCFSGLWRNVKSLFRRKRRKSKSSSL